MTKGSFPRSRRKECGENTQAPSRPLAERWRMRGR
jgi:hypothetical protein